MEDGTKRLLDCINPDDEQEDDDIGQLALVRSIVLLVVAVVVKGRDGRACITSDSRLSESAMLLRQRESMLLSSVERKGWR